MQKTQTIIYTKETKSNTTQKKVLGKLTWELRASRVKKLMMKTRTNGNARKNEVVAY